jgi:hypothetical protein
MSTGLKWLLRVCLSETVRMGRKRGRRRPVPAFGI